MPAPAAPVANYVPWKRAGELIYVSGQLPVAGGQVQYKGVLGRGVSVEEGQKAAKLCAINVLAAVKAAAGELSAVEAVRVEGFVASAEGFTLQPAVVNGASDFLVEVLGEAGRHTRFAVGVNVLPLGACVEVAAVFRIKREA